MSQLIHVFCCSGETLSRAEVIDFVEDGVFFDNSKFQPEENYGGESSWVLEIIYNTEKRPIQLSINTADEVTRETIQEIISEHVKGQLTPEQEALIAKLNQTLQHFQIEIGVISEECWMMLDCLEAFIANKLDGIVYADEGIYDKDLQPLWIFD
jgi:hypothetical protein